MNPAPNLVLVGPMGAGKTSLGKRLASQLGLEFVDVDHLIEASAGTSIAVIFEVEGEVAFRAREEQALAQALVGSGRVISTGGGVVLSAPNRAGLRERGFVVYLRVSIDRQLERLARDHARPLLKGSGDRRPVLESLAAARNPLYEEVADLALDSSAGNVSAATRRILTEVQRRWQRGEAA